VHVRLDVGAALAALLLLTLLAPTPAAAEEPAEQVGEVADIAHVEVESAALLTAARLSGSFSTSYADWTSLKRASAPSSPGLRSG
jgi:hypothetical protein